MRIVIDIQPLQSSSSVRGIGRYVRQFVKAFLQQNHEHEIFLVLNGNFQDSVQELREFFSAFVSSRNIMVWYPPGSLSFRCKENVDQREIAKIIWKNLLDGIRPDLVLITSLFEGFVDDVYVGVPESREYLTAVVLYDLIPLSNPADFLEDDVAFRDYYNQKIRELKKIDLFLAISDFTAKEAVRLLGVKAHSVVNISSASDDIFGRAGNPKMVKEDYQRLGIDRHKKIIFCSGGGDKRKNLESLVKAFGLLPLNLIESHQLIIAGIFPDGEVARLKKIAASVGITESDFLLLGYIADSDLVKLYESCALFVFPSLFEGFGLPVLEAMKSGAPVLASNVTSIPEVVENIDALFCPNDVEGIATKISHVLSNCMYRNELAKKSLIRSRDFSWSLVASNANMAIAKLEHTCKPETEFRKTPLDIAIHDISYCLGSAYFEKTISEISFGLYLTFQLPRASRKQRLFIDISELARTDAGTGVQRVVREITKSLTSQVNKLYDIELVRSDVHIQGYQYADDYAAQHINPNKSKRRGAINFHRGDILLILDLQHHVARVQEPFLRLMHNHGVKVLFVVYDLLPLQFPEYWVAHHRVADMHRDWLGVVSRFDGAICISKSVAKELEAWLRDNKIPLSNKFRIKSFVLGSSFRSEVAGYQVSEKCLQLEHIFKEITFLMVGTLEPRKGHLDVLKAFEVLWSQSVNVNLLIIGKVGWLAEPIVDFIKTSPYIEKKLFWIDDADDEVLRWSYKNSNCLIAASYGEGYGLPLIEAVGVNLPVICRDIEVFREIMGDSALYFDGSHVSQIVTTILEWLNLYHIDIHPKNSNIKVPSWDDSAKELVEVVESYDAEID